MRKEKETNCFRFDFLVWNERVYHNKGKQPAIFFLNEYAQ